MKKLLSLLLVIILFLNVTGLASLAEEIRLEEIEEMDEVLPDEETAEAVLAVTVTSEIGENSETILTAEVNTDAAEVWWQYQPANGLEPTDETAWVTVGNGLTWTVMPEAAQIWRAIAETESDIAVSEEIRVEAQNADEPAAEEEPQAEEEPEEALDTKEEETESAVNVTYAEQTAAGQVVLRWDAVSGALSYRITGGPKTVTVTKTTATFTKLSLGTYTFNIVACSDKKGKVDMDEDATVEVLVDEWTWAAAPTGLKAVQEDPLTAEVTLTWDVAMGVTGYEVSANKKTIIIDSEDGSGLVKLDSSLGSVSLYVRPYRYASDGSRIYGTWSKAAKVKVAVAWMTTKPKITAATQIGEDVVKLTWDAISDVDGYEVYEVVKKDYVLLANVNDTKTVITGVSYGKHSYVVRPYRFVDENTQSMGAYSAAKAVTTKVLWNQAPTLTAVQSGEDTATLSWKSTVLADSYNVYGKIGKAFELLANVSGTSCETDPETCPLLTGKSYSFKVIPVNADGEEGKSSAVKSVKMTAAWQVAPELKATQTDDGEVTLSWKVAGTAETYRVYTVCGKQKATLTLSVDDLSVTGKRVSYVLSGLTYGKWQFTVEPAQTVGKKVTAGKKSNTAAVTVGEYSDETADTSGRLDALQDCLDMLENPGELGTLEPLELDEEPRSTEGVTDPEELAEIEAYNEELAELQTAVDECNAMLDEALQGFSDLSELVEGLELSEDGNEIGLSIDGEDLVLNKEIATQLGDDCEIIGVYQNGDTYSTEIISGGSKFYIITDGGSVSITDTQMNNAKAITFEEAAKGLNLSNIIKNISEFVSKLGKLVDTIDSVLKKLEAAARIIQSMSKHGHLAQDALKFADGVSALRDKFKGLSLAANIVAIRNGIKDYEELKDYKSHGHPTAYELKTASLEPIAKRVASEIVLAETLLIASLASSTVSVITDVVTLIASIASGCPTVGSCVKELIKEFTVNKMKDYLVDALADLAVSVADSALSYAADDAKKKVEQDDEKLHKKSILSGKVTDKDTGEGISGVKIECDGETTKTSSDGTYMLGAVPGDTEVTATKSGYKSEKKAVSIQKNSETGLNFELEVAKGTVSGIVTDKTTCNPIADVVVQCGDEKTTTDVYGSYSFTLTAGNHTLVYSKDGYSAKTVKADVKAQGNTKLNVSIEKTRTKHEIGEHVYFGTYPQTAAGTDKTPIEWEILEDRGDGTYVVMSVYALDAVPYNTKFTDVTWATCSLRSWLNGTFYNTAFSTAEKSQIVTVTNTNADNLIYGTEGGSSTSDKVWILSESNLLKYYTLSDNGDETSIGKSSELICYPTQYAEDNGAWLGSNGSCGWWLRSPGIDSDCAASVVSDGSVYSYGYSVYDDDVCVRPVVALRL